MSKTFDGFVRQAHAQTTNRNYTVTDNYQGMQ